MLGEIVFLSCVGLSLCFSKTDLELPTTFLPSVYDGWKLVGSLNMLDYKNQKCPSTLKEFASKKACGRMTSPGCSSVRIATGVNGFSQVCGRFRAFQWGNTDAFATFFQAPVTIDVPYVDGISITYSLGGKRQHVFTYAAGLMERYNPLVWPRGTCPCAGGAQPPPFVRVEDYYCESGNSDNQIYFNQIFCDPLWDQNECRYDEETCCLPGGQPWFCRDLGNTVIADLEIRLCSDEIAYNEDIALESYELYVR